MKNWPNYKEGAIDLKAIHEIICHKYRIRSRTKQQYSGYKK
jgi:hypothetical protein